MSHKKFKKIKTWKEYSSTLWHPPYLEFQQHPFDTISKMHADGNSYIKIARWMNEQGLNV